MFALSHRHCQELGEGKAKPRSPASKEGGKGTRGNPGPWERGAGRGGGNFGWVTAGELGKRDPKQGLFREWP